MNNTTNKTQLFLGDNLETLRQLPDNSVDAIVTDPPYGLGKEPNAEEMLRAWITDGYMEIKGTGFMGKEWDAFVPQPLFWKEAFRVLKHGGHVLCFFGTRTYDWGVMAMRLAGFEVRDSVQWVYGSGFPKSLNVGKAIDKMYGAEREVIGQQDYTMPKADNTMAENSYGISGGKLANGTTAERIVANITAPATEEAKKWDGWGSALKPANEPIVLARKPLEKGLSIAENVLKWGTGAINIDGCRISFKNESDFNESTQKNQHEDFGTKPMTDNNVYGDYSMVQPKNYKPQGRFPANLILSHCDYKVMNLVGNLPNSILQEIKEYFNGYTKVFDLRERKRSATKQDKCRDEILQSRMQKDCTQKKSNPQKNRSSMSELSNDFYSNDGSLSEREEKVLFSELQRPTSKIDEGRESNKIRENTYGGIKEEDGGNKDKKRHNFIERETSELEGRENDSSRICEHNDFNTPNGLARNGEENATKSNLHIGASDSNGYGNEKTTIGFGERTPHKRDKKRQQTEQFSNRGQSEPLEETSGDRCGNGEIEKREPILEVLDFDVPTEWLRYFEYTGVNLGCECIGLKKVKTGKNIEEKGVGGIWQKSSGLPCGNQYGDENGEETVENWLCHPDCPIKIMDEQSGDRKGWSSQNHNNFNPYGGNSFNKSETDRNGFHTGYNDTGGASRFFYCAKTSKEDRNEGLRNFEEKYYAAGNQAKAELKRGNTDFNANEGKDRDERNNYNQVGSNKNTHPTVKPTDLMRYLCRLITPPNGIVLDPFMGSGSTGKAAILEGFQFIGMEMEEEYFQIAEARIAKAEKDYLDSIAQLKLF